MAFGFAEMEMGVMVLFQRWFGFAGGNGKGLLRWFCDGGWCKWDGVCDRVCLQEERIFGGVWLKRKGVFGGWLGNGVYEGNLGLKKGFNE
ncbi:unnamed protein product [Prunus armeniaca]